MVFLKKGGFMVNKKPIQFSIRLSVIKKLKETCKDEGYTGSEFVTEAIMEKITTLKRKEDK